MLHKAPGRQVTREQDHSATRTFTIDWIIDSNAFSTTSHVAASHQHDI